MELTKGPESTDVLWTDKDTCEETCHGNQKTTEALSGLTISD